MKRFFTATLLIAALALPGAGDLEDLRGLELAHAKLPVYNKDLLQLMIFCDQAVRQGRLADGTNVTLDIIRKNADVDKIKDGWGIKLYPLKSGLADIMAFWKPRLYSEGVMFTTKAKIDQESRLAAGQEPVYFRSPLLDLNGVGFEAEFGKRTVTVKENVHIILRFGESDPRKLFEKGQEKLPAKYEFLYATSDSLQIDMLNNRIVLIGDVKIHEEKSTISSDLMTIFLERKDDETIRRNRAAGAVDAEETLEGVSHIVFDGNVVVQRKLTAKEEKSGGAQKALADHMTYDVKTGSVTLSGGKRNPRIVRGRESITGKSIVLYRNEQRAFVRGDSRVRVIQPAKEAGEAEKLLTVRSEDAVMDYNNNRGEFTGKVNVDDPNMNLQCAKMVIDLKEQTGSPAPLPDETAGSLTGFSDFADAGGKRELDKINCEGGVQVTRRDAAGKLLHGEKALSQKAVFNYDTQKITMSGGTPLLKRENESLTGRELDIYVNEERLVVREESKIVLAAPGGKGKTVILSDASDLNNTTNKLTFTGNVRLTDPRMKLDCDRMEIYLKSDPGAEKTEKTPANPLGFGSENSGKAVEKVICYGNISMQDGQHGTMKTDQLTMLFAPVPPGTPEDPGMFQSNGTRLVKILCDGNFELVSLEDKKGDTKAVAAAAKSADSALTGMAGNSAGARVLKADHGIIDLVKNESEFHDNVSVKDDLSVLKCDNMYIYTAKVPKESAPEAAPQKKAAPSIDDDPDADPFASKALKAEMVPTRIMLTDGLDLERILCVGNVHLARKDERGKLQQAFGEQAEYIVANKEIVLTGKPGQRPRMTAEGGMMRGDRVVVNTATGTMRVLGHTQLDQSKSGNLL